MADEQFRGIHLTVEDIARLTELARSLPPKSGSQPRGEGASPGTRDRTPTAATR